MGSKGMTGILRVIRYDDILAVKMNDGMELKSTMLVFAEQHNQVVPGECRRTTN